MFKKYVLSCDKCDTEYTAKTKKAIKKFKEHSRSKCPQCNSFLSCVPLMRVTISSPPELKVVKRYVRTVTV